VIFKITIKGLLLPKKKTQKTISVRWQKAWRRLCKTSFRNSCM